MSKIFKNMIPYWKSILVILVLLFVQAWCDLSLPSYTSDIIDVGFRTVVLSTLHRNESQRKNFRRPSLS